MPALFLWPKRLRVYHTFCHWDLTVKDKARTYPFHVDDRLKMQHCDRWSLQSEVRRGQAPLSLFYCNLCIYCICNCLSLYVQFISGATPKWFSSRTCKICLKWLWKKSHNLHNLLHNSSFISCNLPHKFRVIWVFFLSHPIRKPVSSAGEHKPSGSHILHIQ